MFIEKETYYPHYVTLEVTKKCNMSCLHCGSSANTKDREKVLTLQEWFKVIDELKELGAKHITLSGGEPFMFTSWKELVKQITNKSTTKANIISNGSIVSERDIIFMKENGVTHLALSIDGTKDVHDKIRKHPGSYDKVMNVIKLCNKHKLNATISTSINQINFDCRKELLKEMLRLDIKIWQIQVVNSFGRAEEMKDEMIINQEQYAQLCEDVASWKKEYASKLRIAGADSLGYCDDGIVDELLEGAEWMGCNAGIYNVGIESNGNVKGCLSLQDDNFISGNVKEQPLTTIWKNDDNFWYTRKYDAKNITGSCKSCKKAEQCKAGCLGMAYSLHKSIYENSYCYKNIRGL